MGEAGFPLTPRFQLGGQACRPSPTASAAGGFSQRSQRGSRGKPPSAALANVHPPWDAAGAGARRCCFPGGAEGAAGDRVTLSRPGTLRLPLCLPTFTSPAPLSFLASLEAAAPPLLGPLPSSLSPTGLSQALVWGADLPIAWSHTSTPLLFSFPATLPLSWQEAACRITHTDLASRLSPPYPAPNHPWALLVMPF